MRIVCIGAGVAALTFSLLAVAEGHEIDVFERRTAAPEGFGVVLWSDHLDTLAETDPHIVNRLIAASHEWSGQLITVQHGHPLIAPGGGFGIARSVLIETLEARAAEVGVVVHHGRPIGDESDLPQHDLLVAADGAGSSVRRRRSADFGASVTTERNRYAWFEANGETKSFQFPFVRAKEDWMWAHSYPHRPGGHTFVVEATDQAWKSERFDELTATQTLDRLETVFRGPLNSGQLHPLEQERDGVVWRQFRRVKNKRWVQGRTVLLGDAAHTTHFSVGSGTRYAMEDAAALAAALAQPVDLDTALRRYERSRTRQMRSLQQASFRSANFLEQLPRYIDRPERDFVRLLQKRRSPLLAKMPPAAFVVASRSADRLRGRDLPY